jgi:O-antigen ligase
MREMAVKQQRGNIPLLLIVLYIYVVEVATPFIRFPMLDAINLPRVLAVVVILTLLISRDAKLHKGEMGIGLALLYLLMLSSFFLSDYKAYPLAREWYSEYWKDVLFYWLIYWSIKNERDVRIFVYGIVLMVGLYELHSWWDFIMGGSYVFQQGIKRMTGVWSGGGIGAANAWGAMGLFFLPLGYHIFSTAVDRRTRYAALAFVILSVLSVIFSGTRAAIICLVVYFVFLFHKKVFNITILSLLLIVTLLVHVYLPDDLKQRYLGSFYAFEDTNELTLEQANSLAYKSAEGRLQGLIDGWLLFRGKPLLGWGPGASPYARRQVNNQLMETWNREMRVLQLHNLYGQMLAETGILGTMQFLFLLVSFWFVLNKAKKRCLRLENKNMLSLTKQLILLFLIYLVYGAAAHTLYHFQWILIFALGSAVYNVATAAHKIPGNISAHA